MRAKIASLLPLLCPSRLDELSTFIIGPNSSEESHVVRAALMDAVVAVGEHAMKADDRPTHNRCLRYCICCYNPSSLAILKIFYEGFTRDVSRHLLLPYRKATTPQSDFV